MKAVRSRSGIAAVHVVLFCLGLFFVPAGVSACSSAIDPWLECYMVDASGWVPAAASAPNGKPVYEINEGSSVSFKAFWNIGGATGVQYNDSGGTNLSGFIVAGPSGANLLPLDNAVALAFAFGNLNIYFGGDTRIDYPQYIWSYNSSSDPVYNSAFNVVNVGGSANSAFPDWNVTTDSSAASPPPYEPASLDDVPPGLEPPPEYAIRTGLANPIVDKLSDYGPVTSGINQNVQPADDFAQSGMYYRSDGTNTYYIKVDGFTNGPLGGPKAAWNFKDLGIRWWLDFRATGYVGQITDATGTPLAGGSEEITSSDEGMGAVTVTFDTPSDPCFYEVRVEAIVLMVLRNCVFTWTEYDGRVQNPAWNPLFGGTGPQWLYDDPAVQKTTHRRLIQGCRVRVANDPADMGICYVRSYDTTPPRHFYMNRTTLQATTGDLICEHPSNQPPNDTIDITMVDNNPYTYYHLASGLPAVDALGTHSRNDADKLRLRLYYTTEQYNYWREDSYNSFEQIPDTDERYLTGNSHHFNVWSPCLVWAQAVVPEGDLPANSETESSVTFDRSYIVDYSAVDRFGNDISGNIVSNGGLPMPAGTWAEDASQCRITWRIPLSAFKEPMPLHLARTSERWKGDPDSPGPGDASNSILRFFPQFCDAAVDPANPDHWNPAEGSYPQLFPSAVDPAVKGDTAAQIAVSGPAAPGTPNGPMAPDAPVNRPFVTVTDLPPGLDPGLSVDVSQVDPFMGAPPPGVPNNTVFGRYGEIIVEDDERPDIFLWVTDTKYHQTYRFGIGLHGDAGRNQIVDQAGWSKGRATSVLQTVRAFDLIPQMNVAGYLLPQGSSYYQEAYIDFANPPGTDYLDFFTNQSSPYYYKHYKPSLAPPNDLRGLWVDEDTRLVFKLVFYDNIDTFEGDTTDHHGEVIRKKKPSDYQGAGAPVGGKWGINRVSWQITDEPTRGGVVPASELTEIEDEYIFRNPNYPDHTDQECSVEISVEDKAGNTRRMKVRFFVQDNKLSFRSIAENRQRFK